MGGAETMLYKLLKYTNQKKYEVNVISMLDEGIYGKRIKELGFEVISLNMKQGIPSVRGFRKAKKHIKNTDIIQTWMYHADLFGYLMYRFSKVKKIIWGIRRSNLDSKLNKSTTIMVAKINSRLSKSVDVIVSCSYKAKEVHERFGFSNKNLVVIPNGFELSQFSKETEEKQCANNTINNNENVPHIVHVGRWNILKDHENLLNALKIVKQRGFKFHAFLIGTDINRENKDLMKILNQNDLNNNINLLDRREDIPALMSAADIFVSSSRDEGFPNVIGEAMACETPCVVTDAGDSAYIVGDTGITVPTKDPISLADGITEMLIKSKDEREHLGSLARKRVVNNFDIIKVSKQFEELYKI